MGFYKAEIIQIHKETPRVKLFRLKLDREFSFMAGEFVIAYIDGFNDSKGKPIKRAYSIASTPYEKEYIDLVIAKANDFGFSGKIHAAKVGDFVNIEGPYGHFVLRKPIRENTTFIAAGSGIASLLSKINTLFKEGCGKKILLLYGIRYPYDFIKEKEIKELAMKNKNFKYIITASGEDIKDWNGEKGRVTAILEKYIGRNVDTDFYICGKPNMVYDTVSILLNKGIKNEDIHTEQW